MKKKDARMILDKVGSEGYDYIFEYYSYFTEVKDKKFHKLRTDYLMAKKALEEYLTNAAY